MNGSNKMEKFQGALIREQGVEFAIVIMAQDSREYQSIMVGTIL
jgi:hypothetical protein